MTFAEMGLRPELLQAIADQGYETPTPVQSAAIPVVLTGEDVLAGAQTGTGKTAGFVLPLLQRLMLSQPQSVARANARPVNPRWAQPSAPRRPIRTLILTPTRELAAQVEESVRTYGKYLPINSTTVFGGVGMMPQVHKLRAGVDVLVATPGRLLDHVGQRTVDLSQVEIFVLDEADRMLDMGFIRDIRRILPLLPEKRQNLLFSATFSDEIKALASDMLNKPRMIEVARPNEESALVTQAVYLTPRETKRDLLTSLIAEQNMTQVLVFTRTKHGADRLAGQLEHDGIVAAAIHGNRSQSQRTKALADFKAGQVRVLVATDIAARGLDIPQMPHVINYELPNVPEDYVHRIGRTGRAGFTGEALSLVGPDERAFLGAIEKLLGKRLERRAHALAGGEASEEAPLGEQIPPFRRAQFERQPQGPRAENPRNGFGGGYGQGRGPSRPRPSGGSRPQVEFPRNGSDNRPARSAASSTPRHRRPAPAHGE